MKSWGHRILERSAGSVSMPDGDAVLADNVDHCCTAGLCPKNREAAASANLPYTDRSVGWRADEPGFLG